MTVEVGRVECASPQEWHGWLAEHHATERSVWLVYLKKSSGRSRLSYEEAEVEALAYGWIDSTASTLDGDRTMLYFARRKPGSGWSRTNKVRIERLRQEDRMRPAGEAAIAAAVADGSWTLLDDAEAHVVPVDLTEAFAGHPGAADHWPTFSPSVRRNILAWIAQAKRSETRARRVEETARLAAQGRRSYG